MPPRRSRRIVGSVVRTTTKVVEETVEVDLVERESQELTQEPSTAETHGGEVLRRTIPVEEQPQTMPARPADSTSQITEENNVTLKMESKTKRKKEIKKRKSSGGGREGYKRYVYRVLKQVHPEMRISGQAMVILNNLMNDMFERLAEEATKLSKYTGGMTLSSREIQGAVRLVLPGELGKHAIAEGTKAVSTYVSYRHTTT